MNTLHYPYWPNRLAKTLTYPVTPLQDFLSTSARRYPDHTAINYYGREISYGEYWSQAQALAAELVKMGVAKGDRVAIYMQNCPHYNIAYYGIMTAGAVVVPLNPMLVERELTNLLNDSGAKVVITTTELYPRVAEVKDAVGLAGVICGSLHDYVPEKPIMPLPDFLPQIPADIDGVTNWKSIVGSGAKPPEVDMGPDDMCLLPYTAGSTGVPKGCVHTHYSLTSNVMGSACWCNLTSSVVTLAALPFFHVTGMVHSMLAPVVVGGQCVILSRWDRNAALDAIEKLKCNHFATITTMLVDLLAAPDVEKRDLSTMEFLGGGGAPLPVAVGELLKKLTGLEFVEGYGMTETISQTHFNPPDRPKLGSIGIPDFGVDARIIDFASKKELPQGEVGELIVSGPEILREYWNKPEETAEAFMEMDGKRFLRTGDICRMDEEGYFYVVDRLKRMINAAGFKVWPAEVESVLYRHPAVMEACVISAPDEKRQETVKAYIVPRPGKTADPKEIIEWSRGQLSAYKYPRVVEIVDALPKSGAGKILWRELQEKEKAGR